MQRRPPGSRRPARSLLPGWTWWLLAVVIVLGFVLFILHHRHQDPVGRSGQEITKGEEISHETLNMTQELLSSTSFARQLVDQMTLAKAYVILAKEHGNLDLAWKFSSQIRNCQRLLSRAAVRGKPVTLEEAHPVVSRLSDLIYKAQDLHFDISTTITTLKKHVQALEERVIAATAQSAAFGQLAVEATPKSLHCLNIKLTEDWFEDPAFEEVADEKINSPRLVDNNLYHFCIFSDNVLATSAVVNSTVSNADHPQQFVFHIVTDSVTYRAMMAWFLRNDFKGCMVEVQNMDQISWLNASYSPLMKQMLDAESDEFIPRSATLLNHLVFYIPELLPSLEKVVYLDDDVVVQKDLTLLFSLDLHGNVIGAVETCLESFNRLYKYLNFSNELISSKLDPQACGWAFGLNVLDLVAWKKADVTGRYHLWQEHNVDRTLWKVGTLSPGLLAFYGLVEPLDRRWHVLGLGYDPEIDDRLIESAAVLHFNGHLKPWFKSGLNHYNHLWEQYVNYAHPFLRDCIVR